MAQYNVTCTCGHNRHCELFGSNKGRQSRLDWYETQECAACWLRGQGKFGAAATAARESGETELYQEIMAEAKARARGEPWPPVKAETKPDPEPEKPLGCTPGAMSNEELADLGL